MVRKALRNTLWTQITVVLNLAILSLLYVYSCRQFWLFFSIYSKWLDLENHLIWNENLCFLYLLVNHFFLREKEKKKKTTILYIQGRISPVSFFYLGLSAFLYAVVKEKASVRTQEGQDRKILVCIVQLRNKTLNYRLSSQCFHNITQF